LRELATAATGRHIDVTSRFQMATILQNQAEMLSLEQEVQQARHAREQAMEAYRQHLETHRCMTAGSNG
jgi:hypothetical protein